MTIQPPTLRDQIAEALMSWAERNANPQYATLRRPETVRQNAYGRADAVLAVLADSNRDAARQTTGQADTETACACGHEKNGHGLDFTDRCLNCRCTAYTSAVGQPAEAQDADRAALRERLRLAIAQQYLDDTGSGRTVDELDDTEFGSLADAALRALTVEDER